MAAYYSPTHLVDPATVPEQPQDVIQKRTLTLATTTTEDTVKFMAQRELLANWSMCEACNRLRTIHQDQDIDGIFWGCPNCHSKKSICHDSFFSGSQVSLVQLLTFIYCWAADYPLYHYPLYHCNEESGNMAEHTQTHWGLMSRGVCEDWLIEHSTQIGGITVDENLNIMPKIVEIDESCFTKSRRSCHHRATPSFWLFGGVERGVEKAFWWRSLTDQQQPWCQSSQNGSSQVPESCQMVGPAMPI